jgi:hypothetical protein
MHAHGLGTGGIANERVEHGLAGKHEMAAELLEQFRPPAVSVAVRIHQPLLRRRQHSLQVNKQLVVNEVGMHVPGATAHVFLLKPRHGIADRSLNLALRFQSVHAKLPSVRKTPLQRGWPAWELASAGVVGANESNLADSDRQDGERGSRQTALCRQHQSWSKHIPKDRQTPQTTQSPHVTHPSCIR